MRYVEFPVHGKNVHDFSSVNTRALRERSNLVRKCHLERVKGVVGVFHHFGDGERSQEQRRLDRAPQLHKTPGGARAMNPDDVTGRVEEVVNRRAFPQKLGVEIDVETGTRLFSGTALE